MKLRRLLLQVMLWSLGIGAAVGATAVLFTSSTAVWRIVGTSFTTALAALLMLAAAVMSHKPKLRAAGLLAMTFVLVEYFGALLLIWDLSWMLFGVGRNEPIALTMLMLAPVMLVAIPMLRATQIGQTRRAGQVGVIFCAIEAVLLLIAIWGSNLSNALWHGKDEWYATAGAFAVFAIMAIASLVGTAGGWRRMLRWSGVLAAAICLAVTLVIVWKDLRGSGGGYAVLVSVAAWLAYANAMLAIPLPRGQEWLRAVTLLAAAMTALAFDVAITNERDALGDWAQRLGASTGILAGCGTLAIAVLFTLNRRADVSTDVLWVLKEITVICPVCRKKQDVPLGDSACAGCGLMLQLRVEPPRCASCGYILLMNKSKQCPECGASAQAPAMAVPVGASEG